jgi:hypothetical protein
MELMILDQIVDEGGLSRKEWAWLHRRFKAVWKLVYEPNARQRVVGAKSGALTVDEQKLVQTRRILDEIRKLT